MRTRKPNTTIDGHLACSYGFCACGCGLKTSIARRNDLRRGLLKGEPMRCRKGHRSHPPSSYRNRRIGDHVQALHRTRATLALGKPLPKGVIIHHADGSRSEHAPLVICQDHAYHMLLHTRMRVLAVGGDLNTQRICSKCHQCLDISRFGPSHSVKRNIQIQRLCRVCSNRKRSERKQRSRIVVKMVNLLART